jgi:hypothetical protein
MKVNDKCVWKDTNINNQTFTQYISGKERRKNLFKRTFQMLLERSSSQVKSTVKYVNPEIRQLDQSIANMGTCQSCTNLISM